MKFYKHKNIHATWIKNDIYTLYVTESGNPEGVPVMCLHGGPGSPMGEKFRKIWDPKTFRVFTFHQRGCGKSKPRNCLKKNKSNDMIRDIEKIRKHFKIKKWIVEGGSWGATLAVYYAIKHPTKVIHLIPFAMSLFETFGEDSTRCSTPDVYERWLGDNPKKKMDFYMKKLTSNSKKTRYEWSKRWNIERKLFDIMAFDNVDVNTGKIRKAKNGNFKLNKNDSITLALYECYYYKNLGFYPRGYILKNAHKLKNIPGHLIHGRFDIICNPEGSYRLSKKWKKAKFMLNDMSGHSSRNVNNMKAMLEACKFCKKYFNKRKSYYEN